MSETAQGYCHFNEGDAGSSFNIELFGETLNIYQTPSDVSLGHGAVVWDAAVVFSKYMEFNSKDYDAKKLGGKRVLELGSGTALAGEQATWFVCSLDCLLDFGWFV